MQSTKRAGRRVCDPFHALGHTTEDGVKIHTRSSDLVSCSLGWAAERFWVGLLARDLSKSESRVLPGWGIVSTCQIRLLTTVSTEKHVLHCYRLQHYVSSTQRQPVPQDGYLIKVTSQRQLDRSTWQMTVDVWQKTAFVLIFYLETTHVHMCTISQSDCLSNVTIYLAAKQWWDHDICKHAPSH